MPQGGTYNLYDKDKWPWRRPEAETVPGEDLPKITIVTPSFNQGQFIERTILSVLHQNYPNLEYIIIDGGSTDETVSILKKHQDQMAYWVSEKDRGQAHAINKGFSRATGEIVAWLNSDDILEPGTLFKVARMYSGLQKPCLISGSCRFITDQGELVWEPPASENPIPEKKDYTAYMLLQSWKHSLAQPSTFWSRSIFDEIGLLNENMHFAMDLEFWLRCIRNEIPVYVTPEVLSTFLYHSQSKTVSQQDLLAKDLKVLAQKFLPPDKLKNYESQYYIWNTCLRKLDLAASERKRLKRISYLLQGFLSYPPIVVQEPRRFFSLLIRSFG